MRKFSKDPIGVCVHHSLTADGESLNARAIRYFHMNPAHNGVTISMDEYHRLKKARTSGLKAPWDESGYHALAEKVYGVWKIIPGRPIEMQGAHCPPLNATHLGLCIVGNFDVTVPDKELLDVAVAWCQEMGERFGFDHTGIEFHCDHSHKSCPGKNFPKEGFILAVAGETRQTSED